MSNRPSAPPPPHLEILHVHERSIIGVWNNVFVMIWRDLPSAERLRIAGALERKVAARFPDGFVVLAVLPTINLRLPSDVREEAERLSLDRPRELKAIAQVIEGKGFIAASVRSVAVGVVMLARPQKDGDGVQRERTPMRIFSGVEPASAWLATFLDREKRATAPRLLAEAVKNSAA
jgi:hypothetical protein